MSTLIASPSVPANLPLFRGLNPEALPNILKCLNGKVYRYETDEIIIRRDEIASSCVYLLDGRAHLVITDIDGRTSILGEYTSGQVISLDGFFNMDVPSPADVVADEPCQVLTLSLSDTATTKPCCQANVDKLRTNLTHMALQTIAELTSKLIILSNRSTRQKVMAYLTKQAIDQGSDTFEIPLSRQELADAIFVERSALSHELSKLQKEGAITFNRDKFTLHENPEGQ